MNSMQEMFDASFNRQVEELRLKIDSLLVSSNSFASLLEATRQQHDEMRQSSSCERF